MENMNVNITEEALAKLRKEPRDWKGVTEQELHKTHKTATDLVNKYKGLTFDQALKIIEITELERQNDLYVANKDIFDEQILNLGKLIEGISEEIFKLSEKL